MESINYFNTEGNDQVKPKSNLSVNMLSYLFSFMNYEEFISMMRINKKFFKASQSDFLWEMLVLKDELFVTDDRSYFKTWKNYFITMKKTEKNIQQGKSNKSFKMKPMRAHSNYITCLVTLEDNFFDTKIISADVDGSVLTWVKNEDGDYQSKELVKLESKIVEMKIVKNEFSSNFTKKENTVLLIVSLNCVYDPYLVSRALSEEAVQLKSKMFPKNFLVTNESDKKKSFTIKGSKLYLINNFDVEEGYHIQNYKSVQLFNFLIFNLEDERTITKIYVEIDYLIEIFSYMNYLVIIGVNQNSGLVLNFYDESDFTLKCSKTFTLPSNILNYINFSSNSQGHRTKGISLYNCSVKGNQIILIKSNSEVIEVTTSKNEILTKEYSLGNQLGNKIINCVNFDNFKYLVCYDDNTIKVFSAKTNELWYNLLGGSMTVIPKSFIANPEYSGFSIVASTKSKIIGVIGNLIREYSFTLTK